MKTILICNQKGGVGKTLIADEIAFALDRADIPYNFYDLDNQGGSIHEHIEREDAKFNIVDTPGALRKELVQWMKEADLIIIPTKMSPRDIPPLETMITMVKGEEIKAPVLYVLNCWNHYRASADFEEWFRETYPENKTVILPQSEIFIQAATVSKSVCEYRANSFPAEQVQKLIGIVESELNTNFSRKKG